MHQWQAGMSAPRHGAGDQTWGRAGASSPAAPPSVLDPSPQCPQHPRALARGPEWLWLWMTGCGKNVRKLVNERAAYNSHLLLPERKHKYKFLTQKIMARYLSLNKSYEKPKQHIKKQTHHFAIVFLV